MLMILWVFQISGSSVVLPRKKGLSEEAYKYVAEETEEFTTINNSVPAAKVPLVPLCKLF